MRGKKGGKRRTQTLFNTIARDNYLIVANATPLGWVNKRQGMQKKHRKENRERSISFLKKKSGVEFA